MLVSILVYLCCGAVAGVLAGLLGVGGGIVIVPMLVSVFPTQGIPPEYVQQLALGTSLASIMITSVSSARAHNKRGAVHWDIFRRMTPGILLGTFFGGLVASHMPTLFLKVFFINFPVLVVIVAVHIQIAALSQSNVGSIAKVKGRLNPSLPL